MSLFPSVGSTVTRVVSNKSGTLSRIEFDDGSSILVRYEALVIDESRNSDKAPMVESVDVEAKNRIKKSISAMKANTTQVPHKRAQLSESAYKQLAEKTLAKQQSRQEQIFKQWETDTGQHDMPAGPMK